MDTNGKKISSTIEASYLDTGCSNKRNSPGTPRQRDIQ